MSHTVAELLVDALERIGVKQFLRLIGDSLNPIADIPCRPPDWSHRRPARTPRADLSARSSMLLTSNRSLAEWVMCSAPIELPGC
jgi:hypothetical protein